MAALPLDGAAQSTEELRQEQAAIESGEGLSARAKKALFRARTKQDDAEFAGAAAVISEFMAGKPDREHPLLLFNLALSHFALDQDALAYDALKKAVALEPRYGRAWLRLGEACYELEKFAEAGDAFARAYDLTPEPAPEILYYAGVTQLMGQQAGRSLATLEKLLVEHRQDAELDWYQALISAAIQAGQPGRVNKFVDWMLNDNAANPAAWELSYQFAAGREDYRSAAASLTIVGYLRSLTLDELVQLGDLYAVISVPLQAARYYEQALTAPGAAVETGRDAEFERLASAWLAAHEYDRARTTLKTALDQRETAELWSLLGDLEYMDENLEAALTAFGRATALDPEFGRGWLMMGYCATELGRSDEARPYLEKAAGFPDQASAARSLLGRAGS
jgi:tetratricopeptide (TPR) repeat protein